MRAEAQIFNLDDFEGPLDLLLHLVENKELDIYHVVITQLLSQYQKHLHTLNQYDLDLGAEFLAIVSSLMLLKSKTLLPEQPKEEQITDESTLRLDILEQLVHYYKFKNMAQALAEKESEQSLRYLRGFDPSSIEPQTPELKQTPQSVLSDLFLKVLQKQQLAQTGFIQEEDYKVSDKIKEIKMLLKDRPRLNFEDVFSFKKPKGELIALFIAMLEVLKQGQATLDQSQNRWEIVAKN